MNSSKLKVSSGLNSESLWLTTVNVQVGKNRLRKAVQFRTSPFLLVTPFRTARRRPLMVLKSRELFSISDCAKILVEKRRQTRSGDFMFSFFGNIIHRRFCTSQVLFSCC